jgi:hypothetical protein
MDAGEQGGDDMLAQAAPVIRATARRGLDDAGLIEDNTNVVRSELTAGHLRPKLPTSPEQGGHRTLTVVLLASAERFGGGMSLDKDFAKVGQLRPPVLGPILPSSCPCVLLSKNRKILRPKTYSVLDTPLG